MPNWGNYGSARSYLGREAWPEPSRVKCEYCGVYSTLGRCDSCGAPNKPAPYVATAFGNPSAALTSGILSPNEVRDRVEVTTMADHSRVFIEIPRGK